MPPTAAAAALPPLTSTSLPDTTFSTAITTPPAKGSTRRKYSISSVSPRTRTEKREFDSPGGNHHGGEAAPRTTATTPTTPARQPAPSQHKPSASVHRASYTTFPPITHPPTSSLLPPARIVVEPAARDAPAALEDPFDELARGPVTVDPVFDAELSPSRWRGHHSRSSSAGGLSDGFRNLNRWSVSTSSSRASNLTNFTRRVSAEVAGAFGSPGRKLHRSKPSTSTTGGSPRAEPPARLRSRSPALLPIPPLQSLPRISTGPSLEDEVRGANVLSGLSLGPRPRLSRRPSNDPGLYWDGSPDIPQEEPGPLLSQTLDRGEPRSATAMPYTQNRESRGHSRSRSSGANGVLDPGSKSREKGSSRPPSQKTMLSKALQKANTAVQLDNAQNVEGARRAYSEACDLLQQVLQRTTAEEDRNKLEAIVSRSLC